MDLDVWGYWRGQKGSRRVTIVPDLFSRGMDDRARTCHESSNRCFIDADGRMVRCIALSGITTAYGVQCPNLYQGDDLQQILTESEFMDQTNCTCGELKKRLPECQACRWKDSCGLGCRAEAMAQGNGMDGLDRRMCLFFSGGCYEKLKAVAEKHSLKYV
jgi:radical SAM protein with 4Fe4S-binding SPASM domain